VSNVQSNHNRNRTRNHNRRRHASLRFLVTRTRVARPSQSLDQLKRARSINLVAGTRSPLDAPSQVHRTISTGRCRERARSANCCIANPLRTSRGRPRRGSLVVVARRRRLALQLLLPGRRWCNTIVASSDYGGGLQHSAHIGLLRIGSPQKRVR
jgi:hypothetical protein